MFALLALPLWIASYTGMVQWGGYLRGMSWHSHEMIFGFAPAVMAGFLLTAVRNWTGQPTPSGAKLGVLAALWVLARVVNLTGPANVAVLLDVAFLPLLGVAIAIPIWRSRNVRNFKILLVLTVLSVANMVYHLSYLNVLPADFMRLTLTAALDVFTILMAIVGGRVIPAFTANAVASAQPRHVKSVEMMALGSLALILAADIMDYWFSLTSAAWVILLALAAVAHGIRLCLWQPHRTRHNPLLWMLPVAYGWIPISLTFRALAQISVLPATAAVHALTLGAISGLMLAMMTRSALGHTGRDLRAGWTEISAFLLIQVAAVIRVGATLIPAEFYRGAVVFSGVTWSLAFAIFSLRYWFILTRPRIDGRPG
jgi:uncharacterized protein involved in response to NO